MRNAILSLLCTAALASCASKQKTPDFDELAKRLENTKATWMVYLPQGHGSGAVIHEDGLLLTCHHVACEDAPELHITVTEPGGKSTDVAGKAIACDERRDLAVVKVDRKFEHPVSIAPADAVRAGTSIYNVGFPLDLPDMTGRGFVLKTHFNYGGVENGLAFWMFGGPGDSGSSLFAVADGSVVGVFKLMFQAPYPQTSFFVATGADDIRAFLTENHIPFHGPGETAEWKLDVAGKAPPYIITIDKIKR